MALIKIKQWQNIWSNNSFCLDIPISKRSLEARLETKIKCRGSITGSCSQISGNRKSSTVHITRTQLVQICALKICNVYFCSTLLVKHFMASFSPSSASSTHRSISYSCNLQLATSTPYTSIRSKCKQPFTAHIGSCCRLATLGRLWIRKCKFWNWKWSWPPASLQKCISFLNLSEISLIFLSYLVSNSRYDIKPCLQYANCLNFWTILSQFTTCNSIVDGWNWL